MKTPTESSVAETPAQGQMQGVAAVAGGFGVPSFEEMERQDIAERPYEVYHPEAETMGPKFKMWPEARNAAKEWNRECPGHVARKRRFFPSPNPQLTGAQRPVERLVRPDPNPFPEAGVS